MSSDEEEALMKSGPQKRRRLQRSCDICRKRKSQCDSANMPDSRCSSCIAFNANCTHSEPTRKRGPKNKHVEELKQQISALEAKLRDFQPDGNNSASSRTSVFHHSYPESDTVSGPSRPPLPEEDLSHDELSERFRAFSIDSLKHRFFGSSSGFMLVKNAIAVKEEYLGRPLATHFRRPEYWNIRPWEKEFYNERPQYVYPESDLIVSLLELYFANVHPSLPLLHRPSFERSVAEGLHLRDYQFGATLLAVLAVASRYSDDPRVFVPGANTSLSSGWKFFNQVQVVRKSLFDKPTIYEVQLYCLITLFTLGTSSPQASWLYLGLGIRFIQERGEHRRKREGHKFTAEDELWKRAFWSLLSLDRTVSLFLGRPSAIHVEDYDVELPLEVDDEYWENPDPAQAFRQPPGKPSLLTYFVCHIRLCEILGSTLRRLYASNKSRMLMGLTGTDWEQRAVAELDSAMNEFLGTVPAHLRWDRDRTGVFFDQSAVLHTMFYQLQITIHRPYIHKPTMLAFPSLAICTSAARSAIHVVDVWLNKLQRLPLPYLQNPVFVSGVVLLLNLFGVKRAGLPIDVAKELAHVSTAMRILKFSESRWQTAGRLWELLQELQSWDGPPPPKYAPKPDLHPADMCPTKIKAVVEPEPTEISVFTEAAGLSSTPGNFFAVADELSPHRTHQRTQSSIPVSNNHWNGRPPSNAPSHTSVAVGQPEISIEQLLEATSGYDVAGGSITGDHWNDSTGLANMMVDDDLMSMWMAAPTDWGNLPDWDAYIENRNGEGFNWSANFGAQQQ
ncbi:fungal-specific transcription factor domain-containing protein [Mycena sp. CBHHK59/15]|nr:fungal-specific transcription factor domain-containing protein [Mycena sp. CBHHK59/15]